MLRLLNSLRANTAHFFLSLKGMDIDRDIPLGRRALQGRLG